MGELVDEHDRAHGGEQAGRHEEGDDPSAATRFCRMSRLVARLRRTVKGTRPKSSAMRAIGGLQRDC